MYQTYSRRRRRAMMKWLTERQFGRLLPLLMGAPLLPGGSPAPCTTFVDVIGVDALLGFQWAVLFRWAVEKETVLKRPFFAGLEHSHVALGTFRDTQRLRIRVGGVRVVWKHGLAWPMTSGTY